jgi:hypothetical protein
MLVTHHLLQGNTAVSGARSEAYAEVKGRRVAPDEDLARVKPYCKALV